MNANRLRPLRRRLSDEATALVDEQRANGLTPAPIHMMLVDCDTERGEVACRRADSLGEWVTGDMGQVTCHQCIEQVHA